MAIQLADRVLQTTTVTGTGAATPAGSVAGYDSWAARYTAGAVDIPYLIEAIDASTSAPTGQWETGLGTWNGTALQRTTVVRSSSGTSLVNFTAGTKLMTSTPNETALAALIYERTLAALEASNAAMGAGLLADLPAATPGNADQVFSARKNNIDPRRLLVMSDGNRWPFVNGVAVIDSAADESAPLVLTASAQAFSTGTIVIPGRLLIPRVELALEYDCLFASANTLNTISVTAGGVSVYAPPGTSSNRRLGGVCRLFMNAAGTGFRSGGSLSGFGYGSNSGGGFLNVNAYTPGADLTLVISAAGVVDETCVLWRWRLTAFR